ncbi:tyrosine-type recombinase/integrase [Thiobacillus denitrificans]|uniref:tyrosine-type recombinase/integrase n=1 Tax=Thiobacillus denitrificans TaxID=36861 RepID=UPI00036CCA83|nr:site-specific integrase [Thiobacillus denitrificans]
MNNFSDAEVSIFFSPERREDVKKGQPIFFLWRANAVTLFEEPTWFLHKHYVTRAGTASKHTWAAAAHDMKCWFQYIQARGGHWRDASEHDRAAFADDYSQSISSRTGHEFGEGTTNRRLSTVRAFYGFARQHGWYSGDIGESVQMIHISNSPIDADALAHIRSTTGRRVEKDPLLRKIGRNDVVRPLLVKELRKLRASVGPSTDDRQGDMRRVRDRIILDCGWVCGMRLNDVLHLTTLKFLSLTVEPGQEFQDFPVVVEKSKGKVARLVSVPGWLVLDIQHYIETEREKSTKVRHAKAETRLFLGHADSRGAGKPISHSAIQKMIALACQKAGIVEMVERVDPETGKNIQRVAPKHSFHDLRHNCAVLTYHAEKARGNSEPWKTVQVKLGHKSLKVTVDTYLAYVELFGEKHGITDIRRLLRI